MRKFLITLLTCIFAISAMCLVGCSCKKNKWVAPEFKDKNVTTVEGGFVAETDNYVLFLNGVAVNTDDNTYKNAVKGSLMVIAKEDLANGEYDNAKILIPKIFASNDYSAGIYIYDDYVYFGTPCTGKNSAGAIAYDEMTFMKAKIDASESPVELLTVPSLKGEYRVVKSGDVVYIVFYDTKDTALKVLNTSDKSVSVIAKKDEKNNVGENEYLSLNEYKFVDNENVGDAVVVYSATVYTEKYYEEKAKKDGYTRASASYNYVYSYKVGDKTVDGVFLGKKALESGDKDFAYTLKMAKAGYIFYSSAKATNSAQVKDFAVMVSELNAKGVAIFNEDAVADTSLIYDLENVIKIDSGKNYLVNVSLVGEDKRDSKTNLIPSDNISKLIGIYNDYIVYTNTNSELCIKDVTDKDAKEIKISDSTINISWYAPEIISIGDKDFIFFADSTTAGANYVHVAELTGEVKEKDTNSDDKTDVYYLENSFIGKIKDADNSKDFVATMAKLGTTIEWETKEDGTLYNDVLDSAKDLYSNLTKKEIKALDEEIKTKYTNAINAEKLANAYIKLEGIQDYDLLSDGEKAEKDYGTKYNNAKSVREEVIKLDKEGAIYEGARDMLENNLKYYYQTADKIFGEAK
ncbi:MAG: hypothetical protein MJ066_00720 [Clostridia bacterium]|nr:hypothetical protein [Clostridia bacterium]